MRSNIKSYNNNNLHTCLAGGAYTRKLLLMYGWSNRWLITVQCSHHPSVIVYHLPPEHLEKHLYLTRLLTWRLQTLFKEEVHQNLFYCIVGFYHVGELASKGRQHILFMLWEGTWKYKPIYYFPTRLSALHVLPCNICAQCTYTVFAVGREEKFPTTKHLFKQSFFSCHLVPQAGEPCRDKSTTTIQEQHSVSSLLFTFFQSKDAFLNSNKQTIRKKKI